MIILLVGPSGVGKTCAYEAIQGRFPQWVFRHLDGLASEYAARQGWIGEARVCILARWAKNRDHFLAIGLQAVADLAARNEGRHLVIDVGAGFQDATYAGELPRQYATVALLASPEEVYARRKARAKEDRSLDSFKAVEFSAARQELYGRCREKIDTGNLTLVQTAERLATILQGLLP